VLCYSCVSDVFYGQVDSQRYLVKHGLIVEKIAKERKLRHVFLFNDILVVAKQKIVNRFVYDAFLCSYFVIM